MSRSASSGSHPHVSSCLRQSPNALQRALASEVSPKITQDDVAEALINRVIEIFSNRDDGKACLRCDFSLLQPRAQS